MLIDFVPDVAGVSLADSYAFIKAPSGMPANVVCAIAKLGGNAAFIGKVGDDVFGHMLANLLKKNGVNNEGICFEKDARTALAFVTLKTDGQREFMFYRNPSADMLLKESELKLDLIRQAKIFHYGSTSLISEPCKSAHLAAMKAAKQAGVLLSYDPNVRLPLWPSHEAAREGIKSIWNEADFVKDALLSSGSLVFDGLEFIGSWLGSSLSNTENLEFEAIFPVIASCLVVLGLNGRFVLFSITIHGPVDCVVGQESLRCPKRPQDFRLVPSFQVEVARRFPPPPPPGGTGDFLLSAIGRW
ncbi:Fructokinase-2 [Hibiscus syriacus]|uniref:Fructokinase-2 n=1 Tax=Hibiscus syriacus TaxID=106335 RepID=A0A6A2Z0R2_HIBSY|nr:Fructokinase-2 [Hibiscus syriacus]